MKDKNIQKLEKIFKMIDMKNQFDKLIAQHGVDIEDGRMLADMGMILCTVQAPTEIHEMLQAKLSTLKAKIIKQDAEITRMKEEINELIDGTNESEDVNSLYDLIKTFGISPN